MRKLRPPAVSVLFVLGGATVSLAELRLHLPRPRTDVTPRKGLAGVAAVIGTYVVTTLIHAAPWGARDRADLHTRGDHLVCAR
jgi:hypothetical protein